MPLDPSIPLQIKSPVIETPDFNKTFQTLSYMRSQIANARAKEEEAARAQQSFEETGAGRRLLSSLGTAPASSAPPASPAGGPPFDEATLAALPQGGSTPAPAAAPAAPAPAARQRSILDPDVQAELYRVAPHTADDLIKAGLATHTSTLEGQQKRVENLSRPLTMVRDEATYQAWRTMMSTAVPPETMTLFPATYPGPDGIAKIQQHSQAIDAQFKQGIEASNAETARMAEKRMGRKVTVVPGEQGGVPIWEYPPEGAGPVPAGSSPVGTPGTGPIPGTERPRTGEELHAAVRLQQGALSNARLAVIEAEIASGGTDPSKDPKAQTPAQRDRELHQYLHNTPQRKQNEFIETTGSWRWTPRYAPPMRLTRIRARA